MHVLVGLNGSLRFGVKVLSYDGLAASSVIYDGTMDKDKAFDEKRVALAAHQLFLWQVDGANPPPNHSRADALKSVGFTDQQSKNRALQQRIRRLAIKLQEDCTETKLPAIIAVSRSTNPTTSPVSTSTASVGALSSKSSSSQYELPGKCRLTSKQNQAARMASFKESNDSAILHKLATKTVDEAKKSGDRRGTGKILKELASREGIPEDALPSERTVNYYIQCGRAGKTPSKKGRRGLLADSEYDSLGRSVLAFTELNAANGNEQTMSDLMKVTNRVAKSKDGNDDIQFKHKLIDRILRDFGVVLRMDTANHRTFNDICRRSGVPFM